MSSFHPGEPVSFDSDDDGVDAIRDEHGPHYIPPRARDERVSRAPLCTPATHGAIKTAVNVFEQCTRNRMKWEGLLTGQCYVEGCGTTLALELCLLCDDPMPTGDMLPFGDGHSHFSCLARRALARGKTRFVILVGGGKAAEFRR